MLEFGCGDGNQLSLARDPEYVGLDPSRGGIDLWIRRFSDDPTKSFFLYDPRRFVDRQGIFVADLSLSLDVIYHLVKDSLFETHMRHLFESASRYVVVYSSDSAFSSPLAYVLHRPFTGWVAKNIPNFEILERIPNKYAFAGEPATGSRADFYLYGRIAE